jgi:hypothetical protein
VIEVQRKADVLKETGAKPGEKEMIGKYQQALRTIIDGLSEGELERAEETAMEWANEGPPREVQVSFGHSSHAIIVHFLLTITTAWCTTVLIHAQLS